MRLSIIIPVLNEAGTIETLLQQLAPARKAGHQLIVVDGGSRDNTPELAVPLADTTITSSKGRAIQMNAGAASADGEVFWFLHADSEISVTAVTSLQQAINAGSNWGRFDVRLSGRHRSLRMVERMMNLRSCLTGIATGDQGIFVTREAFDRVGGYSDIPLMEDIALSNSLKKISGPACIHQPRLVTSSRRWEQNGIVRTIILMWRLRLAYALGVEPNQLVRRYYS